MIAFNKAVPPLPVNVFDVVKIRIISVVDLANDTQIAMDIVCHELHRSVEPDALDRLV